MSQFDWETSTFDYKEVAISSPFAMNGEVSLGMVGDKLVASEFINRITINHLTLQSRWPKVQLDDAV